MGGADWKCSEGALKAARNYSLTMDERALDGVGAWGLAENFATLCELGARFVEGRVDSFPGWGADSTDEESDDVQDVLAGLNRAGFLTLASGRGDPDREGADGRVERRRAFVLGFAGTELVERLNGLGGELWVRDFGAREAGGEPVPVGTRGADVFMEVGTGAGAVELAIFEGVVGDGALRDLEEKRYVILVGMEWGVDVGFWEKLRAELPPG